MASVHDEQATAGSAGRVNSPVDNHNADTAVDELDSAAIAAAMGFSSFGMQSHPNKKRRFNPRADAVVVANSSGNDASSSAGPVLQHPLPQRPPPRANADEIDLEEDGNEDLGPAVSDNQLDGSVVSKARHGQATVAAATDNLIRSADRHGFRSDLTASPQPLLPPPGTASYDASGYSHGRNRYHDSHSWTGSEAYDDHHGDRHGRGGYGGHGGQERRIWWTDYYDPTSNENPWARLEADLGISACGTWLNRNGPPAATAESMPLSE